MPRGETINSETSAKPSNDYACHAKQETWNAESGNVFLIHDDARSRSSAQTQTEPGC